MKKIEIHLFLKYDFIYLAGKNGSTLKSELLYDHLWEQHFHEFWLYNTSINAILFLSLLMKLFSPQEGFIFNHTNSKQSIKDDLAREGDRIS